MKRPAFPLVLLLVVGWPAFLPRPTKVSLTATRHGDTHSEKLAQRELYIRILHEQAAMLFNHSGPLPGVSSYLDTLCKRSEGNLTQNALFNQLQVELSDTRPRLLHSAVCHDDIVQYLGTICVRSFANTSNEAVQPR